MRLDDLLNQPDTQLICVNTDGDQAMPLPIELEQWRAKLIPTENPIGFIAEECHGQVVAAWASAHLEGHASCLVNAAEDSRSVRLDLFDRSKDLDMVVVAVRPSVSDQPLPAATDVALHSRMSISHLDTSGRVTWIDDAHERLLGYSREETVGKVTTGRVHPDDVSRNLASFANTLASPGGQDRLRIRLRRKDQRWLWVEVTRTNLLHTDNPRILCETIDLSGEMQAEIALAERESLLAQLTETLPLGVMHASIDGEVALTNRRWAELTGVQPDGAASKILSQSFPDLDLDRIDLTGSEPTSHPTELSVRFLSPNLGGRHGRLCHHIVRSPDDATPTGHLFTLDDVTASVDLHAELERLARTDHLTQIINRLGIEERLRVLLATFADAPERLRLLYFDLDEFKTVNDTHGHDAGDSVLRSMAGILTRATPAGTLVGRLGGDEFIVVIIDSDATAARNLVEGISEQLLAAAQLTVSVGNAEARAEDDFDSLMQRADRAMYREKRRRRPDLR